MQFRKKNKEKLILYKLGDIIRQVETNYHRASVFHSSVVLQNSIFGFTNTIVPSPRRGPFFELPKRISKSSLRTPYEQTKTAASTFGSIKYRQMLLTASAPEKPIILYKQNMLNTQKFDGVWRCILKPECTNLCEPNWQHNSILTEVNRVEHPASDRTAILIIHFGRI